jgi:mono/diheme cytochrome c family protein
MIPRLALIILLIPVIAACRSDEILINAHALWSNRLELPAAGTNDQIAAGEAVYQANCLACHGADFEGGTGSRIDESILQYYNTAARLHHYISTFMPRDNPGGLGEQAYYDVLAYLLYGNEMIDDNTVISAATVENIPLRDD